MTTYCSEGQTYQINGFVTAPHPKIDFGTERKATNTLRRHEQWLIEQAYAYAVYRGDGMNAVIFGRDLHDKYPKPQASITAACLYLGFDI